MTLSRRTQPGSVYGPAAAGRAISKVDANAMLNGTKHEQNPEAADVSPRSRRTHSYVWRSHSGFNSLPVTSV